MVYVQLVPGPPSSRSLYRSPPARPLSMRRSWVRETAALRAWVPVWVPGARPGGRRGSRSDPHPGLSRYGGDVARARRSGRLEHDVLRPLPQHRAPQLAELLPALDHGEEVVARELADDARE